MYRLNEDLRIPRAPLSMPSHDFANLQHSWLHSLLVVLLVPTTLACGPSLQIREAPPLPRVSAPPPPPETTAHPVDAKLGRAVRVAHLPGVHKLQDGAVAIVGWQTRGATSPHEMWRDFLSGLLQRNVRVLDLTGVGGVAVQRTLHTEVHAGQSEEVRWEGTIGTLLPMGRAVPAKLTLTVTSNLTEREVPGQKVTYSVDDGLVRDWDVALREWQDGAKKMAAETAAKFDDWSQAADRTRADYEASSTFWQKLRDFFAPDDMAERVERARSNYANWKDSVARTQAHLPQPDKWAAEARARTDVHAVKRWLATAELLIGDAESGVLQTMVDVELESERSDSAASGIVAAMLDALAPTETVKKKR